MQKKISIGVTLGILALVAEGLSLLIVTPVLLASFPAKQVGLWIVVTNFVALIQLGQAGLTPVGIRILARAYSTKRERWLAEAQTLGRAYLVAVAGLAVLLLPISAYVATVANKNAVPQWPLLWLPFAFGILIRVYSCNWINQLSSVGVVGMDKAIAVLAAAIAAIGYWLTARNGLPIYALGIVYGGVSVIYAVAAWQISRRFAVAAVRNRLRKNQIVPGADSGAGSNTPLREYAQQSSRFLVLNLSGFLVMNLDVILVERFCGAQIVPYFNILAKLGYLVLAVSTQFTTMSYPFVAAAWAKGDASTVHRLHLQGLMLSLGSSLLGAVVLLLIAPKLIPLWLGNGSYLGSGVLAALLLFFFICAHTTSQATPALATGERHFVDLAILNATCAIAGSIVGGYWLGVIGVPLGNAIGTLLPSALLGIRVRAILHPHTTVKNFN